MKNYFKTLFPLFVLLFVISAVLINCSAEESGNTKTTLNNSSDIYELADSRGLTPDDMMAAIKTYLPSGKHDEYLMFASGGHSGQMLIIGLPSMRLLKVIGVFTPEPWQGWGYGSEDTMKILKEGDFNDIGLTWGDTHHPALSETNGDYDGQFVFINDKANARVAVRFKRFRDKANNKKSYSNQ